MNHDRYVADLYTMCLDADDIKGRVCRYCAFWRMYSEGGRAFCEKKMKPHAGKDGLGDGCDLWKHRQRTVIGSLRRHAA